MARQGCGHLCGEGAAELALVKSLSDRSGLAGLPEVKDERDRGYNVANSHSLHTPNQPAYPRARDGENAPARVACAALCCGFMLDHDRSTRVSEAQREWRLVKPGAGKSVDDLPLDVPLFIARAGQDAVPQVNPSIDAFVAHALRRNLPLPLMNHHLAPHAFDVEDDSETSTHVVQQTLTLLQVNLSVWRHGRGDSR